MPKRYRQHYSSKPQHQPDSPIASVVVKAGPRFSHTYRVSLRVSDGRQFASYSSLDDDGTADTLYDEIPLFGFVRQDIDLMNLAWPLFSSEVRNRFIDVAREFELSMSDSDFLIDDLAVACRRLGIA